MIKSFLDFINESKSGSMYDFGCVMIYPTINNWSEITKMIAEEDVYKPQDPTYGVETEPHVTLLYGLHSDVTPEMVWEKIEPLVMDKFKVKLDEVGKFDNKEFGVVKFNVDSPILHEINKQLSKLPHTTDYPDYKPHMTISYVKNGAADKYVSDEPIKEILCDRIVYTMTNGDKKTWTLK